MNIYKFSTSFFIATLLILVTSCAENNNVAEVEQQKEKVMTEVIIKTSLGDINLELNNEKAPITVENFISIAESGYYEGTIFHRVINGFMIQGGGLTSDMSNKSSGTSPIYKMKQIMGYQMIEAPLQWLELWILTLQQASFLSIIRITDF